MADSRETSKGKSTMPSLPVSNSTRSYWHMTHPNDLVKHRTTPALPNNASVVIIGSGVSGAFAARELISSGIKNVVVLEARDICSGATGRNGGHCQPLIYTNPTPVSLFELSTFANISQLITANSIPCDFSPFPLGACHAYFSAELFAEVKAAVSHLQQHNTAIGSQLSVVEDKTRLAELRIPNAVGAVLSAKAASLHPYKLVTWLWSHLLSQKLNLNIQTNTPATSLSYSDSNSTWTVHTPRGVISTPHVLLTTNAYTAHLLPGFEDLIVPVQGQMCALAPPAQALTTPLPHDYAFLGLEHNGREEDDYLVQRPVSDGGEMMFGGGRMVAHGAAVGVSDDSYVDENVRTYLRGKLPGFLQVYDEGETTVPKAEWTGIMGYSRDQRPWVGGVPGMKGVWVSAGFTGHGMPNAPASGTHVARLIAAALQGEGEEDWRVVESDAVRTGVIPELYIVTEERMRRARRLPHVSGELALPASRI